MSALDVLDRDTPAQRALRAVAKDGAHARIVSASEPEPLVYPNEPEPAPVAGERAHDDTIPDLMADISADENADQLRAVCGILNAFTLAKQNVTGSPYWTEQDIRRFSLAVRALKSTWDTPVQQLRRA